MAKKEKEICTQCGKEFVNISRHKCNQKIKKQVVPEDNIVFVGKRPTMNYVMAVMMVLNRGDECVIKARGRSISHAVDVCEILKHRFMKGVEYKDIQILTEEMEGQDKRKTNVSAMEIVLSPPK